MLGMRIVTGLAFVVLGAVLALTSGGALLGGADVATRFEGAVGALWLFASLVFGVQLLNAGAMLLELVTPAPLKMGIDVPFVAGSFQSALAMGLVALPFAVAHLSRDGDVAATVTWVPMLVLVGFALNLTFVMLTKLHWNFTENTGKALPKG
jgi:hypothetical protein